MRNAARLRVNPYRDHRKAGVSDDECVGMDVGVKGRPITGSMQQTYMTRWARAHERARVSTGGAYRAKVRVCETGKRKRAVIGGRHTRMQVTAEATPKGAQELHAAVASVGTRGPLTRRDGEEAVLGWPCARHGRAKTIRGAEEAGTLSE